MVGNFPIHDGISHQHLHVAVGAGGVVRLLASPVALLGVVLGVDLLVEELDDLVGRALALRPQGILVVLDGLGDHVARPVGVLLPGQRVEQVTCGLLVGAVVLADLARRWGGVPVGHEHPVAELPLEGVAEVSPLIDLWRQIGHPLVWPLDEVVLLVAVRENLASPGIQYLLLAVDPGRLESQGPQLTVITQGRTGGH